MNDLPFYLDFFEEMTLGEARSLHAQRLADHQWGPCALCTQHVQIYRRTLNSGMARSLIRIWHAGGHEECNWVYLRDLPAHEREEGKLRYWGLLEEERIARPDGGRAGYWRVTPLGVEFVCRRVSVPRYAVVFDTRCLRLEGETTSIQTALGDKFDYNELMGW